MAGDMTENPGKIWSKRWALGSRDRWPPEGEASFEDAIL
jgi:hypothetical protein